MRKKIGINVEFGSDFQKKAFEETIEAMLAAVKTMFETRHNKNIFNYKIEDE